MSTFSKKERLCSHVLIRTLLDCGQSFYIYPFRCVWITTKEHDPQLAFSIPKKKIKFAHQRNTIRRKIKSSYRINKAPLLKFLSENDIAINCILVYTETKILSYPQIDEKIKSIIQYIQKQLLVTLNVNSEKRPLN